MAVFDPASIAAAQISGLEPIAGAGLALNLAYLALDRFRYRSRIEPPAEKLCKADDEKHVIEEFGSLEPVRELRWLAGRKTERGFKPEVKGAGPYRFIYRRHQDVVIAVGLAVLCGFTLVTGVAQTVGRWMWTDYLMIKPIPGILFYGCLSAIIAPAASVILGRRCVTWGEARIKQCKEQIAIHLKALATDAQPPTPSTGSRPQLGRETGPDFGPRVTGAESAAEAMRRYLELQKRSSQRSRPKDA